MIVHVEQDGTCRLTDADAMGTLCAERRVTGEDKVSCGTWDAGGEHLWIDVAWLKAMLGDDSERQSALLSMLRYATEKGWTDDQGRVRAHVATG